MKKLIAMLLVLVMAFGLVACGPTASQPESETVDIDRENAVFTGFYDDPQWDGSLPLVAEGEDNVITIGIRSNANVLDFETNEYTLWLEEQTGLDLQFVMFGSSASDAKTQISLMAAGGETLPDIIMNVSLGKAIMKEYGRDGYLANLASYFSTDAYYMNEALREQYPDEKAYNEKITQFKAAIVDPNNEQVYSFPVNYMTPMDAADNQIWINQDWLDALDLEAPTNIEELYDVLVAFRDGDPNGNGKKDEVPMIGIDTKRFFNIISYIINAYIYYLPNYRVNVENDVVYSPYDQPEYREALIFIKKLVDEGLLSTLTWTTTDTELKAMMNPTEEATVGITAFVAERFQDGNDSVYSYVPLDYLDDATGRGGYYPLYSDTISYTTYITADCNKPQIAFRLLDFMSSSENYLRQRWGVEGVDWEYVDKSENLPGHSGGVASIRVLNNGVFQEVNNQCWHIQQTMASEGHWQIVQEVYDGTYNGQIYGNLQTVYNYCLDRGQPEQVMYAWARNDAEDELFSEYDTDLTSYINQARAQFCTGILDPSSDTDWNNYLKELENLHFYDAWIEVAQGVWDREYKN